jgi:hypothetical protein
MSTRKNLWMAGMLAAVLAGAVVPAWAQDTTQTPTGDTPQQPQEPVPAYGQENAPPVSENPPLSGLDLPNLEPHSAPISYIQPGATFSESADSNVTSSLGGSSWSSVTRALGSITLQRLWSHYDLAADYVGGVGYYNLPGQGWKALQQGDLDQKITWKRGELSFRDSVSYLPEGNFGGAYGALGSQGIASLGTTAFSTFWSGGSFAALGNVPRLQNVSIADVSENLTPKSAITAAGGYALTDFYGNDPTTGTPYLNSTQISGQVGYDRLLSAHTQIALVYGYQGFDFQTFGNSFHSHIIQIMVGHRISGRMDLLIAAGPQITLLTLCPTYIANMCFGTQVPDTRIGVAGRGRLRYKFPRTSVDLSYERFDTAGSGIFAGQESDVARLSADRPLTRVWSAFADLGYSRNVRLQVSNGGVPADRYAYGFIGAGVHRAFGHSFHGYASYQFNELTFDHSYCGSATDCNRISNRSVFTLGLDWTPRPLRID